MKLKTISFSVIKQIIAHQECWAHLSPEGLLLHHAETQVGRKMGRVKGGGPGPRKGIMGSTLRRGREEGVARLMFPSGMKQLYISLRH